ncbi:MAG TPA: hypothetical protein VN947_04005 [Polyangia bacterium]|nr:hypothetical protein [Polyangia bacterium]
MRAAVLVALVALAGCKGDDKGRSAPAAAKPAAPPSDAEMVDFCTKNMFKWFTCFDDEKFWDNFATIYYAQNPNAPSDPASRKMWVGVLKDDLMALRRDKAFEQNCKVSLEHNLAPKPKTMATVAAARDKSCAEFASAFGWMTFGEGAFHAPRSDVK